MQFNRSQTDVKRVVRLHRGGPNNSFGFTLRTYGIERWNEVEELTFVDTTDERAEAAGLWVGDVFISVNGQSVEGVSHRTLSDFIFRLNHMTVVVLYGDCVRRVTLEARYVSLVQQVEQKIEELRLLCDQERELLSRSGRTRNVSADPLHAPVMEALFPIPPRRRRTDVSRPKSMDDLLRNDLNLDSDHGDGEVVSHFQSKTKSSEALLGLESSSEKSLYNSIDPSSPPRNRRLNELRKEGPAMSRACSFPSILRSLSPSPSLRRHLERTFSGSLPALTGKLLRTESNNGSKAFKRVASGSCQTQ